MRRLSALLTPARRRWLYLIWTAGVALLLGYGLITAATAPLWVGLGSALLIGPMAAHYVPQAPDARGDHAA